MAAERRAAPPADRGAKVSGRHDTEAAKPRRVRREDPRIEQTRQLVLAATLELMAEHGSAAITVERIAERSGVARSTIYRRWPDLPRLYFEAFRQLRSRATHELTGDLELDLANYIRDTAAHLNDPTYFSIVIFLMANAATSEHYARLHLELFDLASSRGAAVFRKGIERGMVLPDFKSALNRDAMSRQLAAEDFWQLVLAVSRADVATERAVTSGEPSHVARYAFQLAQAFNTFYHDYRVLDESDEEKRTFLLWMTDYFRDQLERPLAVLGIALPEYM